MEPMQVVDVQLTFLSTWHLCGAKWKWSYVPPTVRSSC